MLAQAARRSVLPACRRMTMRRGCLRGMATTIPASRDDLHLVHLFDHPNASSSSAPLAPTGLFGHPSLTHPESLIELAEASLHRAQLLTERILRARNSRDELLQVVKNLDRLSDVLCSVVDLTELVRNAHPDQAWMNSANDAYEMLCEFMNVLNTHVDLYEVLKAVLTDPTIVSTMSAEAHATALMFWRDFERSAIHMEPAKREQFVTLSSKISVLGRQFLGPEYTSRQATAIKPHELKGLKDKGMGTRLLKQAQSTQRDLIVYPGSLQANMIMQSAPNEEARRRVYLAANSSHPEKLKTLDDMLRSRAELANLVGQQSFAHMTLSDKMAKSPEHVVHFLDALLDHTAPTARKALRELSKRKQAHTGSSTLPIIQAWDRDFYCPPQSPAPPLALPPLTLGTVFMGLSRLFQHIYGISLRPTPVASGEVWSPDVHKLEVHDEDKGLIGWIYADLFTRAKKATGAAHYTVRCSRRVDNDDSNNDLVAEGYGALEERFNEFERVKWRASPGTKEVHQLPLVVLLCEFTRPTFQRGATALEWHEVHTLFHEMGHAMHSMVGRTEYQSVSGTRCATDFVEFPSILMEHFLQSPTMLGLFDPTGVSPSRRSSSPSSSVSQEDPCHYIDTHNSILLASLDQIYHSQQAHDPSFSSTKSLESLYNTRGLIPYAQGTSYQGQFGHLFGYGATYYSYLFDRAIASRVWRKVFSQKPLDRENGEKYKREVLRWGGGKDPWEMVASLLDAPELRAGDAEAMAEVGRWRTEDEVSVLDRH